VIAGQVIGVVGSSGHCAGARAGRRRSRRFHELPSETTLVSRSVTSEAMSLPPWRLGYRPSRHARIGPRPGQAQDPPACHRRVGPGGECRRSAVEDFDHGSVGGTNRERSSGLAMFTAGGLGQHGRIAAGCSRGWPDEGCAAATGSVGAGAGSFWLLPGAPRTSAHSARDHRLAQLPEVVASGRA
jgi:hypothetical protein